MGAYLNRGMYDIVEVARLVTVSPRRVVTWSEGTRRRNPLLAPSLPGGLYSFHDLVSLRVLAQLVRRRIPLETIDAAIRDLETRLKTPRPLAHRDLRLATVGSAIFVHRTEEWLDAGKGGQAAFQSIVVPALKGIEYDDDLMAHLWRPRHRVWLNPKVQAGASCVDNRRVPTGLIYSIVKHGDHPIDVAEDYDLELDDVLAAVEFENSLKVAA